MKKILILTADAGFGHRAAANAIAAALTERYGDACRVTVVNPLEGRRAPAALRRAQSDYDRVIQEVPELYQFGYKASDGTFPVGVVEQALIALLYAALRDTLQISRPDAIVTTYPLYQAPLAAIFALDRRYVPILTVVTDLATVHGIWFSDEVDWCLVPTEIVRTRAVESGLPPERVEVTGLPVNPALAQPVDKTALRARLGWRSDRYVALFVGSKRVTRLEPVARAFNHAGMPLELALVAGGNAALAAAWSGVEWHLPAHVYGFTEQMADMIRAADFIVCKAGGLIVSEALAAGLPLLLIEAIPGQETGNAALVVEGGAGEMAGDALAALTCAFHWLDRDGALLAERAANARRLGHPNAAYRVAELAWQAAHTGTLRAEHRLLAQIPLLRELLSTPLLEKKRGSR
ncbi:MAG: glycosyltransferase [Chloroflexi bacterium]|nr:glycosyltransferase [Chloroflexota bacterium]